MDRFPSKEQFDAYFKRLGMTEGELKSDLRKRLAHEELLRKKYGIEVTDAQVNEFYKKNEARFAEKEQVSARHILLKVPAGADDAKVKEVEKKAADLAKQARKSGADFAELAKAHSEGPSAPRGGDLGFFTKERMVPEFSKAAFDLKPGKVSDPVKTQFGWHVIKVEEKKDARTRPFDEVKDDIQRQLLTTQVREATQKLMTELKETTKVELKEENIKVNVAPAPPMGNPMGGGAHGGHPHGGNPHAPGGAIPLPKKTAPPTPAGK